MCSDREKGTRLPAASHVLRSLAVVPTASAIVVATANALTSRVVVAGLQRKPVLLARAAMQLFLLRSRAVVRTASAAFCFVVYRVFYPLSKAHWMRRLCNHAQSLCNTSP
jgi:hypothetical protein